jgi:hypothetical protein
MTPHGPTISQSDFIQKLAGQVRITLELSHVIPDQLIELQGPFSCRPMGFPGMRDKMIAPLQEPYAKAIFVFAKID